MIAGFFHPGSGLGNQLHRYVATRVFAEDHGYDFGMFGVENFKGKDFMNLYTGAPLPYPTNVEQPAGKLIAECDLPLIGEGTNYYNPEFNFLPDNVMIDGEFQDERYFEHRLEEIDKWLKVEPIKIADRTCVIGFRGGEFALFPELFLPNVYWEDALKKLGQFKSYEIHTDDYTEARKMFWREDKEPFLPHASIVTGISRNWRSMRYAKNAIIANSSFYILPRLLKHFEDPEAVTIAPRYWARHNTKEWSMPQNYYKAFTYI